MTDTKHLLERARRAAPEPSFDLEHVRARRDRHERRRRVSATVVGLGLTAAIVVGAVSVMGPVDGDDARRPLEGLPLGERTVVLGDGFAYQRLRLYAVCDPEADSSGGCDQTRPQLHLEAWWALDDSGRIRVLEQHDYGVDEGRFGTGTFPDEGDLSAYPIEPDVLESFLLDRSAAGGASPRPDVTPAPGTSLEQGQLWLAIRDYLGSTQYLNATPELRAALLRVLARQPMVSIEQRAADPLGRTAVALRFHAYGADLAVFVDPTSGDFLAMTEHFADQDVTHVVVVEEAGVTSSDEGRPRVGDTSVFPA